MRAARATIQDSVSRLVHAVFRCDASPLIGAGHVMRCLAAAETLAWLSWRVTFAVSSETPRTVPALPASGFETVLGRQELPRSDIAVFDHYGLDSEAERSARGSARRIVVFDDLPTRRHDADVLVDPTPGRTAEQYRSLLPESARILAGSRFAQIRRVWREGRRRALTRRAGNTPVKRILVSMGATDPHNATVKVLAAIRAANTDAHVDVVLGPAAPYANAVADALDVNQRLHIDPPDLVALATEADLAVGAPGSSSFERACVGLPAVLVPLADNQHDIGRSFRETRAAEVLAPEVLNDAQTLGQYIAALAQEPQRLTAMTESAAALVDGRGPLRLAAALTGETSVQAQRTARLRLAESADSDWLHRLQCQPETRRFARNPGAPVAAQHAQWMEQTLDDPERILLIVEVNDRPTGMVRLDRIGDDFEVSIAIDPAHHGQGVGRASLLLVRRLVPAADLLATVLPENVASLALFAAAGYRLDGGDRYRSCQT